MALAGTQNISLSASPLFPFINMAGGTSYSNIDLSIRRQIVKNIEKRNLREKEPFEVLIGTCK